MKRNLLVMATLWGGIISAQVGINMEAPQSTLDINGSLRIIKELKVGGSTSEDGNVGKRGDVLVSTGKGEPPRWIDLSKSAVPGALTNVYGTINTDEIEIPVNETKIIGKPITIELRNPSVVLISTTALPLSSDNSKTSQGSIDLLLAKGNTTSTNLQYKKISSSYWYSLGPAAGGGLDRLGTTTTSFERMQRLEPGTYTINVQAKVWANAKAMLNVDPIKRNYSGATPEDKEAFATRLSVMVFNGMRE